MSATTTAAAPDPGVPHVVGPTRRATASGMYSTSCSCGTTVHDTDRDTSAAALDDHRAAGAERAARLASDVPSFKSGGTSQS